MTNIAEILKDYPKGTKLYSPICGECKLIGVHREYGTNKVTLSVSYDDEKYVAAFDEFGRYIQYVGECLLFPSKDDRDWNTFRFKKGDFIHNRDWTCIYYGVNDNGAIQFFAFIPWDWNRNTSTERYDVRPTEKPKIGIGYINNETRLATEDEKALLLSAIEYKGYIWDAEKLELREKELEIYPGEYYTCIKDFKHNGHDVLKVGKTYRGSDTCHCVTGEENRLFVVGHDAKNAADYLRFSTIDEIRSFIKEKNKPRFKPFDKVLVRDELYDIWQNNFFGCKNPKDNTFSCITGEWKQCIPYEGNEHLLGTTENPE